MMISIIIPTYNESKNIPGLLREIERELSASGAGSFEILVMDDDSPDGTAQVVNGLNDPVVRAVNRRGRPKGLSASVIDGFREAKGDMLGVMDADLSHPPAVLPKLIRAVQEGENLAVASRYVPGGGIRNWPLKRVIASKAACWMARPFTRVKDATSGFFVLRRSILDGVALDALGFKIGLEVIVKSRHGGKIREIPYVFTDRRQGQSKFGLYIIYCYLKQLASFLKRSL